MNKTALITGATDGIGRATALSLAKKGYTIHVLGRNGKKGGDVMETLRGISNKPHKLFLIDLASVAANTTFLDNYLAVYSSLDVLILNALAFPGKGSITPDGLESTFAVGYVSRYIFSIRLEPLLQKAANSRVIHIGQGFKAGVIDFDKVTKPVVGKAYGLLEKAVITLAPYKADAMFTYFVNRKGLLNTAHEYYHPGTVDTQQVKESPRIIRFLGKLFGEIISPEESGNLLAEHIEQTKSSETVGKYYSKGRVQKTSKKMKNAWDSFLDLIDFSEKYTGLKLKTKAYS